MKTQEIMERVTGFIERAIQDAAQAGDIPPLNPKSAARQVYSVILGGLLRAKVENNPDVLADLGTTVLHLIGVPNDCLVA